MRLDTLTPITLAELNESAALMTRVDRKYLLVPGRHDGMLDVLHDLVAERGGRVLEVDERREFSYASLYFDSPDDASHRGAAHRRRRRFKVRLRCYVDAGERHLEVKTRGQRGTTVKERVPLALDAPVVPDGASLPREVQAYVAEQLTTTGIEGVDVAALRHRLTSRYRRRTVLLSDGVRLTLDTDLTWSAPAPAPASAIQAGTRVGTEVGTKVAAAGLVVVETKSPTGLRASADRALWDSGCRPVRFSKYATGRALTDPTVPANRWHRTIQRDLIPFLVRTEVPS